MKIVKIQPNKEELKKISVQNVCHLALLLNENFLYSLKKFLPLHTGRQKSKEFLLLTNIIYFFYITVSGRDLAKRKIKCVIFWNQKKNFYIPLYFVYDFSITIANSVEIEGTCLRGCCCPRELGVLKMGNENIICLLDN